MLKRNLATTLMLAVVAAAGAEITPNLVVYDVGPLLETGQEYVTYRVVVALSEIDDWTSAEINASVTDAEFYQNAYNDGNPPDPNGFGAYPDSEVSSYYTSPEDHPNAAYSGAVVGFNVGPNETATTLQADWFDTITSADGTYVIAQITVLPDSSSWSGQVDVTVYSTDEPGGVSDSWTISAADYEPVVTATYTGPSGGTYNDPNNWDVGVVPLNVDLARYNVIIPGSTSVNFDITGESQLSGLALGYDSTFGFVTGESLLVNGTAVISGIIDASGDGAAFLAPSQFSAFSGSGPKVFTAASAHVHIAAPSYTYNPGISSNHTIMSAEGNSLLDLSSMISVSVPFSVSYARTYTIAATNSGVIDMHNVSSVTGAATGGDDWLRFLVSSGGNINLEGLTHVLGRTWFDIDVPAYSLLSLENASNTHIDATDAVTVDLPNLGEFNSGTFTVPGGATIDAPLMGNFIWSSMSIADGGSVNVPELTNVTGSYLELNPTRVLNVPPFTNIDHARILLSQGATLPPLAALSYTYNSGISSNMTILSADGTDTLLDCSSLTSVSAPFSVSYARTYTIAATNDGVIDMHDVGSVTGAAGDDWLRFLVASGGNVDLQSLSQIDGRVQLDIDAPDYELPSLLETTGTVQFNLNEGTTLHVPILERIQGSGNTLNVPVFATFDAAPPLTEMNGTTIELAVGGTIDAPNLTTFTSGVLTLTQIEQGGPFLNFPPFTNINHSRIILEDGSTFAVDAPSYTYNTGISANITILSADGTGSLLDLSSLTSVSVPFSVSYGRTYTIAATNNGVIDMHNVSSVTGAAGSDDWLKFTTDSGGHLLFGDLLVSGGRTQFVIDGTASGLDFTGGLTLETPSKLAATLAATVNLTGDYSFNHTNEDDINTGGGVFHMNGAGTQLLEVGGEDIGVPDGAVSDNFEIGQLMVGQMAQPTIVKLVDNFDNGNRGTSGVEALYLQGFPGSGNGLRILGGSTLVIQNIQVYAQEADEWVHINSLFPPETNQIAYDDGFIALSIVVNDCNENGIDDHVDILLGNSEDCNDNDRPDECEIDINSGAPGGPFYCTEDCDPDCNINGIPDECDIADCDPNDPACQDCNENDVPDACDIADGTSQDTNDNGIPDECEDCNNNGIPDYQDMADCDGSPWCDDCNANGILDWCDIDAGTSEDVNSNGIPDSCEEDCQPNGVPDGWDIETGTSQDCQPNGVPDECDIADGTSNDINGNEIPDECEPDCQPNGVPDDWDISTGISQDCNENEIPDECDIADGTSEDVNGNGIPDECEPDCQPNGVPDDWDITTGTSEDCNENDVPDECDIADGTSLDTDGNGVPDECQDCNNNGVLDWMDILNGTSEDCNGNMIPDECEGSFDVFLWIGPDGGSFDDPANWDLGGVPGGEAELVNTSEGDNTCVLAAPGETMVCKLTVEGNGTGHQTLEIDDATLISTGGTSLNFYSDIALTDAEIAGGEIVNDGYISGYGEISASLTNTRIVESYGGNLVLTGDTLTNSVGGTLRAQVGTLLHVRCANVTQAWGIMVNSGASMQFDHPLTNEAGGLIGLAGGSFDPAYLTNALGAEVSGFGTINSSVDSAGEMLFVADTQIVGNLLNDGTITIQNGTLTILGDLTNNGSIIGDFVAGRHGDPNLPRLGGDGFFVQNDFVAGADSSLQMVSTDAVFRLGGDFDVAITDNTRYDMVAAELRMVGLGDEQGLELMSRDIGANPLGLDRTQSGRYPLGTLHIGPTPATVLLVDNHDNDGLGQAACEAAYVHTLQIDAGATLINPTCRIYYEELINNGTVTNPENLIQIAIFGDLNGDGAVDLADLAALLGSYGETSGMSYEDGDLDGDGDVDLADLAALLGVYGNGT